MSGIQEFRTACCYIQTLKVFGGFTPVKPTLCSWQETNVWNPGETPKPSWWMYGGSFWLWIWTRIPASSVVSSENGQIVWVKKSDRRSICLHVWRWTDVNLSEYIYTVKKNFFEKFWKLTIKYWLNKLLSNNYPQTKRCIGVILAYGLKVKLKK